MCSLCSAVYCGLPSLWQDRQSNGFNFMGTFVPYNICAVSLCISTYSKNLGLKMLRSIPMVTESIAMGPTVYELSAFYCRLFSPRCLIRVWGVFSLPFSCKEADPSVHLRISRAIGVLRHLIIYTTPLE